MSEQLAVVATQPRPGILAFTRLDLFLRSIASLSLLASTKSLDDAMDGELAQISDVARQTASLLASGDDDDKLSQIQAALHSAGKTRAKELEAQRDILRCA